MDVRAGAVSSPIPGGNLAPVIVGQRPVTEVDLRAARRALRSQIARLEGQLAEAFVAAYPSGGLDPVVGARREPRLLDLGELEQVRDELVARLAHADAVVAGARESVAASRVRLQDMLCDPAGHRFARVSCRDLGLPGCGVWEVRPRLGLIGMLMGWWQVKLSSGCPLPGGRGRRLAARLRPVG